MLAEALVGRRDHGDLGHAVDAEQQLLDLLGADVLAAPDDDVRHAVGDREVAVVVEHADVAGAVPPVGVEHRCCERRVGVAHEAVGPTAGDLADLVEPDLDAGERVAVGVQPLGLGLVHPRAGDRRVLGAAVRAERLDAEPGRPLGDSRGHRRAAEPGEGHAGEVLVGEVRVVEDAGEEVRRSAAHPDVVRQHQAEDLTRVPHVHHVHRVIPEQRHDEGVQHPDEVAHRGTGDGGWAAPREHEVELSRLARDRAVRVDHALGVLRGPRREGDQSGRIGIHREARVDRRSVEPVGEALGSGGQGGGGGVADHQPPRPRAVGEHGLPHRQVVEHAEPVRRDHDRGIGGVEDVRHLLGAVEVHDRDHHGAQVGGGPERDAGLHPVGQLEHDDVAGPDAVRRQRGGEGACRAVHVGHGAGPRPHLGSDVERRRGALAEAVLDHRSEGAVVPPPRIPIVLRQLARRAPKRPLSHPSPFRRGSVAARLAAATGVVQNGEWDYHPPRW